ncbi:MATE family efflux transporter [Clostridium sp. SM-530-WT-3G]|uniref:MATE family efflux transporter n=1 Tax=Clostridium sp. SM-530-WT-3G TaxID=2725303 RepID=UPI00145F0916|nr:MATE family efflux transporter [Clostridium sp. SM-530-WT-3G]NME82308.1 MATE family efflux transporter [Clostridium sp. SM-530-WT-3G]
MNGQKRLGEEKISKLLLEFSIPAIIGMLVNTLYNIIDRIFIGHIPVVGNLAIAGVGITMPLMTIIMAFGMLIGIGTATRVSINLGQHNREKAEEHLGNAFTLIIIISILLTVFGLVFMDKILFAFGASENTILYAEQYIEIIFAGCIFNLVGFGLNHSIRSDGSPKVAMLSMIIGAITNIILDPILIFIFNLGVRGGAIATVISQFVSAIWVIYYFTKGKSILKIKRKYLKLNKLIVLSIFSIGVSPFSMQIANCAVQIVANNSLQTYGGDLAVAAMTVINSLAMVFLMPIFGINQGMQPIVGYNFGAKQYNRVRETVTYCVIAATTVVTIGFLVIQFFPDKMIMAFNNDPNLINIGVNGIRIFLCMLPFIGGQIVITNYFQSIGKVKISMFLSLLRQVILLIPCLIILPTFKGLDGIWLAGATSDFISVIITVLVYRKMSKELSKDNIERSATV